MIATLSGDNCARVAIQSLLYIPVSGGDEETGRQGDGENINQSTRYWDIGFTQSSPRSKERQEKSLRALLLGELCVKPPVQSCKLRFSILSSRHPIAPSPRRN